MINPDLLDDVVGQATKPAREAQNLTGAFAVLLSRIDGAEHALAHRVYTFLDDFHLTLAADQSGGQVGIVHPYARTDHPTIEPHN